MIKTKMQQFREVKNLTQEEMAEKLNISLSAYGKIERGETNLVHRQLKKIAEILEVEIYELLPDHIINHVENHHNHIGMVQTDHYYDGRFSHDVNLSAILSTIQSNQEQLIENQQQLFLLLKELLSEKK